MKILQTIAGFGAQSGGTSTCTYDLISAMRKEGCLVDLLTLSSPDLMGQGEKWIKALPNDRCTPYGYSKNMTKWLNESNYDLYHANGVWSYCNQVTCQTAQKHSKPYVITPHGMLYPAALKRSYWKKWLIYHLCLKKNIQRAAAIHATCVPEMEHIRNFGYHGPIAVIANPANLPDYLDEVAATKLTFLGCNLPRKLGFLGRLHPRKKVENLLYGVSKLSNPNQCELVIMGKGDDTYEKFLHSEIERLGLKNVTFCGFVSGRTKYEQLAQLSCLFVPSDFENFGMIITEALSVGTPVMASLGTPWEELNTRNCGWWVERSPENIAQVMQQVIDMQPVELLAMGNRGRQLVQEKYTAQKVASQMIQLYDYILRGGKKPDFVFE